MTVNGKKLASPLGEEGHEVARGCRTLQVEMTLCRTDRQTAAKNCGGAAATPFESFPYAP